MSNLNPIIVIGSSTGGPQILEKIIFNLPSKDIAPILIIQHMPKYFTSEMADRFNKLSNINVSEAKNGQLIQRNSAIIAAGGQNLRLDKENRIILENTGTSSKFMPSIDMAMKSVAENQGNQAVAIILSGMGKDGLEGAKAIKAAGGMIIAQDPSTCLISSMPNSIIDSNLADEILTPDLIVSRIIQLSK